MHGSTAEVAGAPAKQPWRIALLDDHEVLLNSLSSWIEANAPDFDVVLTARSWIELVHSSSFPTDLVILDFQLQEPISIEARVRTCRAAGAAVVVLTSLDSREARDRALAAGAAAFLSKSLSMPQVMDAARTAMGVALGTVLQHDWRPLPSGAVPPTRPKLSNGEETALRLYASGLSTSEVAEQMDVQYETAKTYLRRVREKYARVDRPASRKADLIRRAAEDGYLR